MRHGALRDHVAGRTVRTAARPQRWRRGAMGRTEAREVVQAGARRPAADAVWEEREGECTTIAPSFPWRGVVADCKEWGNTERGQQKIEAPASFRCAPPLLSKHGRRRRFPLHPRDG